jgi:hypothetical protein
VSGPKERRLKNLLTAVPPGFLVDSPWLTRQGITKSSVHDYARRGWLERLERGVFRRPFPEQARDRTTLDWQTCILSVQHLMEYGVHVGGTTALRLQGHAHYLGLGESETVWLYGRQIPHWLAKLRVDAWFVTRTPNLFAGDELGISTSKPGDTGAATAGAPREWTLPLSSPERAILEALDELPKHESFDNLDMIFEGLVNLRPRSLRALLENCKKIKVRRLFFVFADRHDHAWRKHIRAEDFDLGRGDRALFRGGKIHPRYRIVVPAAFVSSPRETTDGS